MARVATLWPGGISPDTVTFSSIRTVPDTSCARAITTSSLGCRRMVSEVLVSIGILPLLRKRSRHFRRLRLSSVHEGNSRQPGRSAAGWVMGEMDPWASGSHQLHLRAARLVARELERLDGARQRKLTREQRRDVDATRGDVFHGPVELDAP